MNKIRPVFFSNGAISATFQLSGTQPFSRDELIILVMIGPSSLTHNFTSQVVTGSSRGRIVEGDQMVKAQSSHVMERCSS